MVASSYLYRDICMPRACTDEFAFLKYVGINSHACREFAQTFKMAVRCTPGDADMGCWKRINPRMLRAQEKEPSKLATSVVAGV